jgi:hypothetical protein
MDRRRSVCQSIQQERAERATGAARTRRFLVCHDSAVAHDRAAGAPVDEIEITPEMVEAGASAV